MTKAVKKIEEMENIEYAAAPVDAISGKVYLEFMIREKGEKKMRKIPALLPRCPFCGEIYPEKE